MDFMNEIQLNEFRIYLGWDINSMLKIFIWIIHKCLTVTIFMITYEQNDNVAL